MRYRPLLIGAILSAVVIICSLVVVLLSDKPETNGISQLAVQANEVDNLVRSGDTLAASEKAQQLVDSANAATKTKDTHSNAGIWIVCITAVIMINACIIYIWRSMVKPFHKLEAYADKLASGEFDAALDYERSNYFGKFTWAFDNMRREIVKARSCEKAAIENNKTVIASLSHDLKTPVASITAYCEALANGFYSNTEEMYSYLDVISAKCAEVAKLTNDMITHSIGELNALKMDPVSVDLCSLIETQICGPAANDIEFEKPLFPVFVSADPNRLAQLFGNLVGNARKYAGTKISISITKNEHLFSVHVRDYGQGISDEDMPFVLGKFYRGSNSHGVNGSGLGLYIVEYIAGQSGGQVMLKNEDPGLEVTVTLPEEKQE